MRLRSPRLASTGAARSLLHACGARIADRYDLRAVLAEGRESCVVEAEDLATTQIVAVKLAFASSSRAFARQDAERRAAMVGHPNVRRILDAGVARGVAFLVVERLGGESLEELVTRAGPLPAYEAFDVVVQLLDALASVHAASLVHRDVTAKNVFLVPRPGLEPVVKLIDFGMSVPIGAPVAARAPQGVDASAYAAPEESRHGLASPGVDLWACGIVLFEALTGRLPFGAPTNESGRFALAGRGVPAAVAPILDRSTAREPRDRFASAAEMQAALLAAARDDDDMSELPTLQWSRRPRPDSLTRIAVPSPRALERHDP